MLLNYKILTVTHRHSNLKCIGKYALPTDKEGVSTPISEQLKAEFQLEEFYYVATCNRILFVFYAQEMMHEDFVERFFKRINPHLTTSDIEENVQALEGIDAVEHLLEVGASIDSLVIGERQILGQLREAYQQAEDRTNIGHYLRLLFQHMVVASKDVYANTRIGDKPLSIASLATRKLLAKITPQDARLLIIGAGETNLLVSKFLHVHTFKSVTVFNRTLAKAQQVAAMYKGQALPLDQLGEFKEGFDCIIVCTGAQDPILTQEMLTHLLQGEDAANKTIVDLAIPHNTAEAALTQYPQLTYIEIEGLREVAAANREFRQQELENAKLRLRDHIDSFPAIYQQRRLELAMRELPEAVRAVRMKAVNEVFSKEIEGLDDNARDVLERALQYMEKKCIGIPMRVARESLIEAV